MYKWLSNVGVGCRRTDTMVNIVQYPELAVTNLAVNAKSVAVFHKAVLRRVTRLLIIPASVLEVWTS